MNHTHVDAVKPSTKPTHGMGHADNEAHGTMFSMILLCTVLLVFSVSLLAYYVYYKKTYFIPYDTEETSDEEEFDELEIKRQMELGLYPPNGLKHKKEVTFGGD